MSIAVPMGSRTDSMNLLPLLRECKQLDEKRATSSLTPAEHGRWLELKHRLGARLGPSQCERRASARLETRLDVSFETPEQFQEAVISNLSLGGMFVSTAFPAEMGTKLTVALYIESIGTRLDLPCVVVSQNVGAGFDTSLLGMGLKFAGLTKIQRKAVDRLYAKVSIAPKKD